MQVFKFFLLMLIWALSAYIGILISKRYSNRVQELREVKNALNVLETKIKFTYQPLPEIFSQLSQTISKNIGSIFELANQKLSVLPVTEAWAYGVENSRLSLNEEDKNVLKELGRLLR